MDVGPGTKIGGKYELQSLLGKGSMGEVWLARHVSLDDVYAVKLVDTKAIPDAAGRFELEARIAATLSRKTRHIVSVTDHGEEGALAYLVMQLLEGESLEARIDRGQLPVAEISTILTQVARALTFAHAEGFVHRDLKPANIFLTSDEDGRVVVKLLDFGIARSTKHRTRSPFATAKDTLVGTPNYMSPEQTLAVSEIDHRCDLWALSVVAYEALTQAHPFEGESIQDVLISIGIGRIVPLRTRREDLPDEVYAFFDTSFADELGERWQSASDLAKAFALAAGVGPSNRPSLAPAMSMLPPPSDKPEAADTSEVSQPPPLPVIDERPRKRRDAGGDEEASDRRILWVGIALCLAVAGFAVFLWMMPSARDRAVTDLTTDAAAPAQGATSAAPALTTTPALVQDVAIATTSDVPAPSRSAGAPHPGLVPSHAPSSSAASPAVPSATVSAVAPSATAPLAPKPRASGDRSEVF